MTKTKTIPKNSKVISKRNGSADPQRSARQAQAYRDLEGPVCELLHMSALAARAQEGKAEMAHFTVYHLEKMVKAFSKKYYAAYRQAEAAGKAVQS